MFYRIRVKGHLPPVWASSWEDFSVQLLPNGETVLAGELPDQAALYGMLGRIHALNLPLLSVDRRPENTPLDSICGE